MRFRARQVAISGVLVALAMALSVAERLIPLTAAIPIPGLKLGLSNIVTMFALFYMGTAQAFVILTLRCLLASLFTGLVSLALSLSGGLLALLTMALLKKGYGRAFSLFGVSMGGAVCHNIGQIGAAAALLGTPALFCYLPFLLVAGLATGLLTAAAGLPVFRAVGRSEAFGRYFPRASDNRP